MATYWTGSKQISKSEYDAIQAKNIAWKAQVSEVGLDAMQPARQPSGKQPVSDPVDSSWSAWQKIKEGLVAASTPEYSLISEEEYKAAQAVPYAWTPPKLPSGKQPVDTSALNAIDQDTLRRLQEEADRKRMEEQLAAAATHGKEIVFEFSRPISSKANTYVSKLVKLLGGKRSYIEDQTKLVVVM